MPNRIYLTLTKAEKLAILGRAKQSGLSLSNYVRQALGLPIKQHGGKRMRKKAEELNGGTK